LRTSVLSPFLRTRTRQSFQDVNGKRKYAVLASNNNNKSAEDDIVKIVEVGPRDGLQNEKGIIPVEVKVELIDRLVRAGVLNVEAGSFVRSDWVPQMAGTPEVLRGIKKIQQKEDVHYPVLIPNQRGLQTLLELLEKYPAQQQPFQQPLTDEISVFTATTDSFAKKNLNCTVAESLKKLESVTRNALDKGLRVRGYLSMVIVCPFEGKVDSKRVREVTKELVDMGCYEVSLGDTVGRGRPHEVAGMLEEVKKDIPVDKLAGHFHDTYGMGVANVFTALEHGIRTIDASIAGLGGCPYAPGATGNVATEDVLYALAGSRYSVKGSTEAGGNINLEEMVEIGSWISEKLGRETVSRAGRALGNSESVINSMKLKLRNDLLTYERIRRLRDGSGP